MRRDPARSTRGLLLVALLLGGVACSEGCVTSDKPLADPLAREQVLDRQQLRELLWPKRERERWIELPGHEVEALEQLIELLLRHAEQGELAGNARRRATALASMARVELSAIEVDGMRLWVVSESAERLRGAGAYVIRRGRLRGRNELLLQAPHCFFDQGTGEIAVALLLESEPGKAPIRALFVNTVHRHRQADGSKREHAANQGNPADAAHAHGHPYARVTRRVLALQPYAIVQLHGFDRDGEAGDPEVIVSSGSTRGTKYSRRVLEQLRVELPELEAGLFGEDTDRLGGTTNVQGQSARELNRCFVHVELSREVRDRLLSDARERSRFTRSVLEVRAEGRGDCR